MDTFRVELPQPQTVINEDEFVTNSGRKIKRPVVDSQSPNRADLKLPEKGQNDMLGSGLSVLSLSPGDKITARDGELSDAIQAELHLSLDRLSENYDAEELKRLQEKSENSRIILLTERKEREKKASGRTATIPNSGSREGTGKSNKSQKSNHIPMAQDSLDAERNLRIPQLDSENSEEFVISGEEDDIHTVVADSLNFPPSINGLTPKSKDSSRKGSSSRTPVNTHPHQQEEDEYADLRYNPNWRKMEVERNEPTPPADFNAPPRPNDSLEGPLSSGRGEVGGEIVMHKKELLYSPVVPEWGKENFPMFSARSVSPTRLSSDPIRLQQTNAKYEDEFNRMLKAEIMDNAVPHHDRIQHENFPEYSMHSHEEQVFTPRKESYSVLLRKLDSQERPDDVSRIGGYQLLPDRHRLPSPVRAPVAEEIRTIRRQQRSPPKHVNAKGGYVSPETYFYAGKKDPLIALSPREKRKPQVAPTPPKVPKPKGKDYVELNKQRLGRKTNSAGYLDLHRKKSRQSEQLKARSHSEIRGTVSQETYNGQTTSPQGLGYEPDTVEDMWAHQAERLKVAKGENVNKGKVIRSPKKPKTYVQSHNSKVLVSPNAHGQYWENANEYEQAMNGNEWHQYNPKAASLYRLQQHQQNNFFRPRHALPLPSQAVQQSPRHAERIVSPSKEELMDSLTESGFRRQNVHEQESPIMKAYHNRYTTDVFEPTIYGNHSHVLRQNFNEENLSLPPQRTTSIQPDIWTNPEMENELQSAMLPPSHLNTRQTRKVTFLGDNEPVAIEGNSNGDPIPSTIDAAAVYNALNKYRVPLPPTPPSKSQRHSLSKERRYSEEKENEGYYDVRQDSYPILPPILKSNQKHSPLKQSPNGKEMGSPKSEFNGSYLDKHEKQKKKFQYKIYTLNDYKNLKKDVKLGGLGPDLESAREKMGKAEKARNYAEMIRKEHMTNATVIKPKEVAEGEELPFNDENYHFSTRIDETQRKGMLEKRKRAIEYSKKIPKPKPKPTPPNKVFSDSPTTSDLIPPDGPAEREGTEFNWGLLQMLKDRHEKEKAQVAAFSGNA